MPLELKGGKRCYNFQMGGSSAGTILITFAIVGGLFAYWFYDASHFASGNTLILGHRSFFPVKCSVGADRAADNRQNAQAYFWQGNVRIDLQQFGETTLEAHEIVKPAGTDYSWREDSSYGQVSTVTDWKLTGVAEKNEWFCFPWLFVSFSKFDVPGNISFQ